jgi:hypothetical protein
MPQFSLPTVNIRPFEAPDYTQNLRSLSLLYSALARGQRGGGAGGGRGAGKVYHIYRGLDEQGNPIYEPVYGGTEKLATRNFEAMTNDRAKFALSNDPAVYKKLANLPELSTEGQAEVLESIRKEDIPRLEKTLKIPAAALIREGLAEHEAARRQQLRAIEDNDWSSFFSRVKEGISTFGDNLDMLGASAEEKKLIAKRSEERRQQAIAANPYWQEQERLRAEGRLGTFTHVVTNPLDTMADTIGDLGAGLAGAVIGAKTGSALGSALGLPGALGGAVGGAVLGGLAGVPFGVGSYTRRVVNDPNLSDQQKTQAIEAGSASAGLTGFAANALPGGAFARSALAPISRGAAALAQRGIGGGAMQRLANAGTDAASQGLLARSVRALPASMLEGAMMNAGQQFGENVVFNQTTGLDTPLSEYVMDAALAGAVTGVPFAPFNAAPAKARRSVERTTDTTQPPADAADSVASPVEPIGPSGSDGAVVSNAAEAANVSAAQTAGSSAFKPYTGRNKRYIGISDDVASMLRAMFTDKSAPADNFATVHPNDKADAKASAKFRNDLYIGDYINGLLKFTGMSVEQLRTEVNSRISMPGFNNIFKSRRERQIVQEVAKRLNDETYLSDLFNDRLITPDHVAAEPPNATGQPTPAKVRQTEAEPVAEPVAETVAETVQQPVAETVQQPVAESVQQPVAETVQQQQPVAETVQQPVAETVQRPVAEPARQVLKDFLPNADIKAIQDYVGRFGNSLTEPERVQVWARIDELNPANYAELSPWFEQQLGPNTLRDSAAKLAAELSQEDTTNGAKPTRPGKRGSRSKQAAIVGNDGQNATNRPVAESVAAAVAREPGAAPDAGTVAPAALAQAVDGGSPVAKRGNDGTPAQVAGTVAPDAGVVVRKRARKAAPADGERSVGDAAAQPATTGESAGSPRTARSTGKSDGGDAANTGSNKRSRVEVPGRDRVSPYGKLDFSRAELNATSSAALLDDLMLGKALRDSLDDAEKIVAISTASALHPHGNRHSTGLSALGWYARQRGGESPVINADLDAVLGTIETPPVPDYFTQASKALTTQTSKEARDALQPLIEQHPKEAAQAGILDAMQRAEKAQAVAAKEAANLEALEADPVSLGDITDFIREIPEQVMRDAFNSPKLDINMGYGKVLRLLTKEANPRLKLTDKEVQALNYLRENTDLPSIDTRDFADIQSNWKSMANDLGFNVNKTDSSLTTAEAVKKVTKRARKC